MFSMDFLGFSSVLLFFSRVFHKFSSGRLF